MKDIHHLWVFMSGTLVHLLMTHEELYGTNNLQIFRISFGFTALEKHEFHKH